MSAVSGSRDWNHDQVNQVNQVRAGEAPKPTPPFASTTATNWPWRGSTAYLPVQGRQHDKGVINFAKVYLILAAILFLLGPQVKH